MKTILICALILFCNITNAQIDLKIKDIEISNISIKETKVFLEGMDEGPYLNISLLFINNNESSCILYPLKSELTLLFRYKNELYSTELFLFPFEDKESLTLQPNQTICINVGTSFLLGTDISKINKKDYTKEMIEILPTIQITYRDKTNNLKLSEILNVTVK